MGVELQIPGKILAARIEAKLTQEQLAREIGCTTRTIVNWESGLYEPRPSALSEIADATGRPLAWFLEPMDAAA